LAQAAFNTANNIPNTLTGVSGTFTANGLLSSNSGIIANGYDTIGYSFRINYGGYGAGFRNDGINVYLLDNPSSATTFSSHRPFS